jgi:hypothetical protein
VEAIANQQVSAAETERMMKVQEVILKALVGSLKWSDAAEIIGISDRSLRRWRQRYEQCGYDGLYDRRKRRPSPKRIPIYYAQFGEGRRHAHADASGAGGDRKPRGFLRFVQRPGEPFLRDTKGGKVDPNQLTQLGRALQGLGIKMIPAYSPQARGRMYADLASS